MPTRVSPPALNQDYGENVAPPPQVGSGGGSGTVTSITATAPIVVTPSPITATGVVSANVMGASGGGHASGVTPDTPSGSGTTKFLREDASWAVPPGGGSTSPLTTKGDVWGYSTGDARIPIGANDYVLTADSTQTLGLKWAPSSAGNGLLKSQEFTANGTFTPASGVTAVWITMVGGGGGGSTRTAALGGAGGGAGELVDGLLVPVSGAVTVTIGSGGAGAAGGGSAGDGSNGGDTSFGSAWVAKGGLGALGVGAGVGGGARGGAATGALGTAESPCYFGGSAGGQGSSTSATGGSLGGGSGGYPTGGAVGTSVSSQGGGGGGAASQWGIGGAGGNGGSTGNNAPAGSYGAGGGGAGGKTSSTIAAGNGLAGYVLVGWIS